MENIKSVKETGMEKETSLASEVETTGEQESSVMEVEPKEQESSVMEVEPKEQESSVMEVEPKEQESVLSETGNDDNEGKSRQTTWVSDLQVENDATVAGTLRAHNIVTDMADAPRKGGHGFYSSGAAYDHTPTHIDIDDSKQAEDGIVGLSLRNADNKLLGSVSKLYTGISEKDKNELESGSSAGVNQLRAWIENALAKLQWQYLSKVQDDNTDHSIGMTGLAVNGNASVTGNASVNHDFNVSGNATLNNVKSPDYDNAAEQGFSIERQGNGYHAFLTNLTVWGKAVFNELEIRKLSYAGGNIYLSGAGSKIIKAVPVKEVAWNDGSSTWKECEVTDKDCAGWKCYLLADDGTTATMNFWQEGDQARCQTTGEITSAGTYENAANRSYWRTIPDGGVSTANEKIYGTQKETYTDADGNEHTRETRVELYDGQRFAWIVLGKHAQAFDGVTEGDTATPELQDLPMAGDTIVLDGNRHRNQKQEYDKQDRQNVILLETTGDYAPRMACYANITEYRHTTVNADGKEVSLAVFETSPKAGTTIRSSKFAWTSDDGSAVNVINYRGEWSSTDTYHKNDQVNHANAVWVCVANSGVSVKGEEPSDTSVHWKKVLSGGKGDKGDPGTPGNDGKGVDHMVTKYYAWKYSTLGDNITASTVWSSGSTTMPTDFSDDYPWLWQVTMTYYTDGTSVLGEAVCVGYKGKDGKDAATYGVQVAPCYETWSDAKKHEGIKLTFTKTTGTATLTYENVQVLGKAKVYADGTEITDASDYVNSGNNTFAFDSFTFDGTNNTASIGTASVITVELLVSDTVVATANYALGKQGKDAVEITVTPDAIVFDTDDNGLVASGTSKAATVKCKRGGKDVTITSVAITGQTNCSASVSGNTVTINSVDAQQVTVGGKTVTVSKTSGSVQVTVTVDGVTYPKTIPFSVNVARYTGGIDANNKRLLSQYTEISSKVDNAATKDELKEYDSKIEQTARNISLHVMEKNVGRRNLLVGSAFRKQGEGVDQERLGDKGGILKNSGYEGTNCVRTTVKGENYAGVYWRNTGGSRSIQIKRNAKYTLSVWAKAASVPSGLAIRCEAVYSMDGVNTVRDGRPTVLKDNHPTLVAGTWTLYSQVIQTDNAHDWMECNFWGINASDSSTATEVLFCRPMLEEGDEYNGWTLSEQDYDYVGGNLLDGTGTLAKTGNTEHVDGTVTKNGMGESASVEALLTPTESYHDTLQWSTASIGIKAGEDYVLSFYARASSSTTAGRIECYLYPNGGDVFTEDSEGAMHMAGDGSLQYGIVPTTQWKRYWVHWRPIQGNPGHVLIRLFRPGTDRGDYSSTTAYAVGDVVKYDGTYYVCKTAGTGNTPSTSSSYWVVTTYDIFISQPKLEVGATMTEWTEKRGDMVDKAALYATGIDIDSKKITLTASNTTFRDNDGKELAVIDGQGLRAGTIATAGSNGRTVISGNTTVWYQKDNKTPGISIFYDEAGVPHLQFYKADGTVAYDLGGPGGLQYLIENTVNAYSSETYLRSVNSVSVDTSGKVTLVQYCYVASKVAGDLRYVYHKQTPSTDVSKNYDSYDGVTIRNRRGWLGSDNYGWPQNGDPIANGWYAEPNDANLPMKIDMMDSGIDYDPKDQLYYQDFFYYLNGKRTRQVRAYFKRYMHTSDKYNQFGDGKGGSTAVSFKEI